MYEQHRRRSGKKVRLGVNVYRLIILTSFGIIEPEPSPTIPSPRKYVSIYDCFQLICYVTANGTSQPNYLSSQNATTSTHNSSKSSQDSLASLEAIDKRVADAVSPHKTLESQRFILIICCDLDSPTPCTNVFSKI